MQQREDVGARRARRKQMTAEAWEAWIAEPANLLLADTLGDGADPDRLRQLLSVVFRAGCAAGEAGIATEMVMAFLSDRGRER